MRKPMGDKRREMSKRNRSVVLEAYRAFELADPAISRVMTPDDFKFQDIPIFRQARFSTQFSEKVVEELRARRDFSDGHVDVLKKLDGTAWNEIPQVLPKLAKANGLKAGIGLVDAVMRAMGVPDEAAAPAVDRKGNPVAADGWKITERVPLSEDIDEHMKREVLPFAPDARWDPAKAKDGNDIPFTRIFYTPETPHSLAEIDADVERIMGELVDMFKVVSDE